MPGFDGKGPLGRNIKGRGLGPCRMSENKTYDSAPGFFFRNGFGNRCRRFAAQQLNELEKKSEKKD
ncbi:MAG: DUF5320 domain-containing protein [Candidatus Diapherotrites archaeon]